MERVRTRWKAPGMKRDVRRFWNETMTPAVLGAVVVIVAPLFVRHVSLVSTFAHCMLPSLPPMISFFYSVFVEPLFSFPMSIGLFVRRICFFKYFHLHISVIFEGFPTFMLKRPFLEILVSLSASPILVAVCDSFSLALVVFLASPRQFPHRQAAVVVLGRCFAVSLMGTTEGSVAMGDLSK